MADHRPWLKLWTRTLMDPDMNRLSLHDWGCWMQLLLHVAINGERGVLVLRHGIGDLCDLFTDWSSDDDLPSQEDQPEFHPGAVRVPTRFRVRPKAKGVRRILKRLPGVTLTEASFPDSEMTVTFTKWAKYQVDDSTARVRKWREVRRQGNAETPLPGNDNSPLQRPLGNGARSRSREEKNPPTPLADDNPAHIRFNIPDR